VTSDQFKAIREALGLPCRAAAPLGEQYRIEETLEIAGCDGMRSSWPVSRSIGQCRNGQQNHPGIQQ
jgi:hypothetical protein